jgi:hypothetical protein
VKVATSDETAEWLRAEYAIYAQVRGDFLPLLVGWDDAGGRPLLILEDLGDGAWPPPWTDERIERVLAILARLAVTPAPLSLPSLESYREDLSGWIVVARDPAPFLSLGLCSSRWLESALPTLVAAETAAPLAGDALVHLDVRSDNICFIGERTLLVDWNWACRGNPQIDIAAWLPSLRAESGPKPTTILPDEPELAALMAGFFGCRAGLPEPSPDGRIRPLQLRQLRVALPWAAEALGLPPPRP